MVRIDITLSVVEGCERAVKTCTLPLAHLTQRLCPLPPLVVALVCAAHAHIGGQRQGGSS